MGQLEIKAPIELVIPIIVNWRCPTQGLCLGQPKSMLMLVFLAVQSSKNQKSYSKINNYRKLPNLVTNLLYPV